MLSMTESLDIYHKLLSDAKDNEYLQVVRELCLKDLFFLLTQVCNKDKLVHPWVYDRIREIEAQPDGYLDLWARGHYKSTIITFGKTIQDILNDPDITVGILSHTKGISRDFVFQIQQELQDNSLLKKAFSDILWENPKTQAPRWSIDRGLVVKRSSNPKESTVEGHGLTDGQPTGKHFGLIIYDDTVEEKSVSTVDQINKTTKGWELSVNLANPDTKYRYIGTRYSYNDTYREILDRGVVKPRIYTATDNGKPNGKPVIWTKEYLDEKIKNMGPYVANCQLFLDPQPEDEQQFLLDWLKYWSPRQEGYLKLNRYIIVDPANEKKKNSDYTAIWIIGYGKDDNYYIIDIYRDRLNLSERTALLFELHRKYRPHCVYYEKYGKDTDIEHIQYVMRQEQYRFNIVPVGGKVSKRDRIKSLIPVFENGRIYLPYPTELAHRNYEGKEYLPVKVFIDEEYLSFPYGSYDDLIDSLARINSPEVKFKRPGGMMKQSYILPT